MITQLTPELKIFRDWAVKRRQGCGRRGQLSAVSCCEIVKDKQLLLCFDQYLYLWSWPSKVTQLVLRRHRM